MTCHTQDNTTSVETQPLPSFFRDPSPRLIAHVQRLREVWELADLTDEEILQLREAIISTAITHNIDLSAPGGFREACLLLAEHIRQTRRGGT